MIERTCHDIYFFCLTSSKGRIYLKVLFYMFVIEYARCHRIDFVLFYRKFIEKPLTPYV